MASCDDAFGRPLRSPDLVLSSLRVEPEQGQNNLLELLRALAKATASKISSQMKAYISGPYAKPTEDMLLASVSAPVHNMWAERTLGILDALKARAPNASLGFLEPKVRAQMNKTLEWVESKDVFEQREMIQFCVGRGRVARKMREERGRKTQDVLFDRQKIKNHKKDVKGRGIILKEMKIKLVQQNDNDSLLDGIPEAQIENIKTLISFIDTKKKPKDIIIEKLICDNNLLKTIVK